ncbi:MAG: hypothetical protein KDA98_09695, partial [Acidimicrobiales bacterium]|nr:hypothetical protein [Acidimicrobiales bacterium]
PARTHRKAALEALPAAEQVIGEQVLQGGLPAVRQAVQKQNEQAKAQGGREVAADPLLAIAERLLPDLRAAEWLDRAEAAVADLDELDLRDLRSVVVAAESGAKGEEARALAEQLQTGLAARVEKEQAAWIQELTETLADGRTVRALRLSSRPPKAGAPLPPELAAKLAEAASAGLTADTHDDRWATVLDALSYSPVHLTVAPESTPEKPSEALVATVTKLASRVPKVAEAFGIEAPAQPARRRSRGGKGKKPAPKAAAPAPTPPTAAEAPTGAPPAPEAEATEPTPATEPTSSTEPTPATEAAPTTETPATDAAVPETTPEPQPDAATEEVAEAQEATPQEAAPQEAAPDEATTEAPAAASTPTDAPGDAEGGPEAAEEPPA